MTQSRFENLSAIVDGEHFDDESLNQISNDEALQSKWQSYHLNKDAMRQE